MRVSLFRKKIDKSQISTPYEIEQQILMTPETSESEEEEQQQQQQQEKFGAIDNHNYKYNSFLIEKNFQQLLNIKEVPMEELLQNLNVNRNKAQSRYYIYDNSAFQASIIANTNKFDIFTKPNGITHKSCRHVLHGLIKRLKDSIVSNPKKFPYSAMEIFSPTLVQLQHDKLFQTKAFINELFPHDGCSLRGPKLTQAIDSTDILTIIISLRVLISLLPNGLITGANYEKFIIEEASEKFHESSFYSILPLCLPTDNHPYLLQEYLDLLIVVWCNLANSSIDSLMDLLYISSALCFQTPDTNGEKFDKDIYFFKQFYSVRNEAFQRLFISYVRNLLHEGKIRGNSLPNLIDLNVFNYPPQPYQTSFIEYGLVISVPRHKLTVPNLSDLVTNISNAKTTVYSSHDVLYFDEGVFLRKFCKNPYVTLKSNVSELSLEYLKMFDNDHKLYNMIQQQQQHQQQQQQHTKSANFSDLCPYSSNDIADSVRVSKLVMTSWFFNTWKFETSMGNLSSTFIFELKGKIGQVNWLVITCDDQPRGVLDSDNCIDPELINVQKNNLRNSGIANSAGSTAPAVTAADGVRSATPIIDSLISEDDMFVISEAEELEIMSNRQPSSSSSSLSLQSNLKFFPSTPTKSFSLNNGSRNNSISLGNCAAINQTTVESDIYGYLGEVGKPEHCNLESSSSSSSPYNNVQHTPRRKSYNGPITPPRKVHSTENKGKKRRHSERESVKSDKTKNDGGNFSSGNESSWAGTTMNDSFGNNREANEEEEEEEDDDGFYDDEDYIPGVSMLKTSPRCTSLKELLVES
ncbi:hypothetical protein DASC09_036720 [Saccharomycopsis crataegensis]|uniref:Meiotically up-regulated protein Msb1/Mug8 domain-containing protein n=1 Tax=Saccharomycopsis crataegensis TaxID=43959 RepID=A0AAV5QP29_9ASCO|nr:hypothetical protein DASC09_036720 [Saccharomycopsis crataegensis]